MTGIEYFGLAAIIVMVASYALENRSPIFVLIFALACAAAALYALLIGSYPFFVAESLWSLIAARRWFQSKH